jgi:hypothetical protein
MCGDKFRGMKKKKVKKEKKGTLAREKCTEDGKGTVLCRTIISRSIP